jgi:tripartite-type tricarboxylate transporter receptor subunit TctC
MGTRESKRCFFRLFGFIMFVFCLMLPMDASLAQSYPTKEIKLVVPFPPGGVTDLTARVVANYLSKKWGQTVSVANKPGEGGTTGTMFVLRGKNDGYTMLMSATGQATQNPAIESRLPYKWDEPTLVARTNVSPLVFVVKGDSPWKSLREVMEDVKRDPARFKYGTSGSGGVGSIAIAQLLDASGIDPNQLNKVVFQGGAAILAAVIEGQTHFAAQYLAEMRALLEGKKIKGLAVSTANRVRQLPDVPTGPEAGFDAFRLIGWNGIAGPSNLPGQVVDKWNEGIREMVKDPEFLRQTDAMGATAAYLGPHDFSAALEVEYKTALKFAEKLGLRK